MRRGSEAAGSAADMGFLKFVGMWLLAALLLGSAVVFGWVAIKTQVLAGAIARRTRRDTHEELVRRACADLDDEYRELLRH